MKEAPPPVHINMTYEELGDYVGNKTLVQVTKQWFDSLVGIEHTKKGCTKCNEFLPLEKFGADSRRHLGKRSQCKSCYKNRNKSNLPPVKAEEEPKIEYTLTQL